LSNKAGAPAGWPGGLGLDMVAIPADVAEYEYRPSPNGHKPRGPGVFAHDLGVRARLRRLLHRAARFLTAPRVRKWVQRKAVTMVMNALIAAAAGATAVTAGLLAQHHWPDPSTWGVGALELFVLWCLAFLPGWLYVRFLDLRAESLWNEYVLNLHRLGWDSPGLLPRPPRTSHFYQLWKTGQKDLESEGVAGSGRTDNIYQQKFEAYYGREVPRVAKMRAGGQRQQDGQSGRNYQVKTESLFPVFLATAVFAVSWAAVLWNPQFITAPHSDAWDVLKYAFLGSYAFVTSMLIRRFFQSDLRPSAYASSVYRIILVLLVIVALHQVIGQISYVTGHAELAIAFMIGFFPLVGLQALQRLTSRLLRRVVPPVTSEYPLDQLDGLNLWYEARFTEEGVEDMQNLITMNLVDVILHTRVPTGRLVDWIDQAFLLTHLDRTDRGELNERRLELARRARESSELSQPCRQHAINRGPVSLAAGLGALDGADARLSLRRFGVRTATDLLKMFSVVDTSGGGPVRRFYRPPYLDRLPLPVEQLRLLVSVLCAEPGLTPVWNWQANGVPVCQPAHNGSRCPA
jgi:hypothetical protein